MSRWRRIAAITACIAFAYATNGIATPLRMADSAVSSSPQATDRDELIIGSWACQSVLWYESGAQGWSTWRQTIKRVGTNRYASTEGPNTVTMVPAPGPSAQDRPKAGETRTYSTSGGAQARYSFVDDTVVKVEFVSRGDAPGGERATMPSEPAFVDISSGLMTYGGQAMSGGKYIVRCKKE